MDQLHKLNLNAAHSDFRRVHIPSGRKFIWFT